MVFIFLAYFTLYNWLQFHPALGLFLELLCWEDLGLDPRAIWSPHGLWTKWALRKAGQGDSSASVLASVPSLGHAHWSPAGLAYPCFKPLHTQFLFLWHYSSRPSWLTPFWSLLKCHFRRGASPSPHLKWPFCSTPIANASLCSIFLHNNYCYQKLLNNFLLSFLLVSPKAGVFINFIHCSTWICLWKAMN